MLTLVQLVYLPASPAPHLQSFSAPITSISDTHIAAPFFGPNVWTGVLKPTTGGGIPAQHAYIELKMTFKEGGAFDFHSTFERVKESLVQAQEVARETGRETNLANVGEQLPAYEEVGEGSSPRARAEEPQLVAPTPLRPGQSTSSAGPPAPTQRRAEEGTSSEQFQAPNEPPPGYEEVQSRSVMDRLEEIERKS